MSKISEWQYSNVPRTIWKNFPSKTWEIWLFSYPNKKYFFLNYEDKGYHVRKFLFVIFKLRL